MAPPLSGGLLPSPPLPLHLPLLPPGARVAIIGAGAAGLATASAMAAAGLAPSIFEARPVPGGTWAGGPTTAIYDRLRTNLPVQVMQYAGRPFARGTAAYPPWRDVAAYLEDVAVGVPGEVRYGVRVERVVATPRQRGGQGVVGGWAVTTRPVDVGDDGGGGGGAAKGAATAANATTAAPFSSPVTAAPSTPPATTDTYAAVVVCTGHYTRPRVPSLPGAATFPGRVTHSFEYKHPAAYAGRRVVLLGAGASGVDIAVDVADTAAAVYLSHRGCKAAVGAAGKGGGGGNVNGNGGGGGRGGVTEVPALTSLRADGGVGLADGTTLPAIDDVLLCTGYEFTFPFLPPGEGGVTVPAGGATVDGLYRQLVAVASPTLAFVGLPIKVVPLPLFQDQAAWLAAAWTGRLVRPPTGEGGGAGGDGGGEGKGGGWGLPSAAAMAAAEADDAATRRRLGVPERYRHVLADAQWEYRRRLCDELGTAGGGGWGGRGPWGSSWTRQRATVWVGAGVGEHRGVPCAQSVRQCGPQWR